MATSLPLAPPPFTHLSTAACSQGALFNEVVISAEATSAVRASASHLTLLNSFSNAGKLWPLPLALAASDGLGYAPAALGCFIAGAAALPSLWASLRPYHLQHTHPHAHASPEPSKSFAADPLPEPLVNPLPSGS